MAPYLTWTSVPVFSCYAAQSQSCLRRGIDSWRLKISAVGEPFLVVSLLLKSLNSIFIVWLLGLVTMPQCHAAMPCLPQTQCMNDCTKGCALESKVSHLRRSCVHFGQSGFAKSRSTCDRLGAWRRLSSRIARS